MSRLASAIVVVALFGGTAVAFAVTQGLKLERSPIVSPRIDKFAGPSSAEIAFVLRRPDRLTVSIVDSAGEPVRTLARGRFRPGRVALAWDGRNDAGALVPEGAYKPQVRFAGAHRTIVLPNEIELDLTEPRIELLGIGRRVFSPDGDGHADGISVRFRVNEAAHGLLLVNGKRRARSRWQREVGNVQWYGKVRGRSLRPGTYEISLRAVDLAGNASRPTLPAMVRIRYVELGSDVVRAQAGTRFSVRVRRDAPGFRWLFAGRSGFARGRSLVLRAPKPGRYQLFVEVAGRADRAFVVVRPRP